MFLLKIENIEFEKQALISCHKLNLKNIQKQKKINLKDGFICFKITFSNQTFTCFSYIIL
jgi:hypothetical protein